MAGRAIARICAAWLLVSLAAGQSSARTNVAPLLVTLSRATVQEVAGRVLDPFARRSPRATEVTVEVLRAALFGGFKPVATVRTRTGGRPLADGAFSIALAGKPLAPGQRVLVRAFPTADRARLGTRIATLTAVPVAAKGPPDPLPFTEREVRSDGAIRLTFGPEPASYQNACFSSDGNTLYVNLFEKGDNRGPAHLMRLKLDGSAPVALTGGDYDDVIVPTGAMDPRSPRLVFASDRDDAADFWTIDLPIVAAAPRRLTAHGPSPSWIEPVFSPSGDALAFECAKAAPDEASQRSSVWRVELPGGGARQLTNFDGRLDDRLPAWSPDGSRIAFQRRDPAVDRWEAYLMPAAGGEPFSVSTLTSKRIAGNDTDLSWSPDGRFIASSADHDGLAKPNIFLLPVSGGPVIRVTRSDVCEDGAPAISPNGRWIAFESHRTADETSPSDLWIIRTPAGGIR